MINPQITIDALQKLTLNNMASHLGIEFIEVGKDYLRARMPVDERTRQPFGILHGGASVALAETLGSIGASCCIDLSRQHCVGLEINANHVRSVECTRRLCVRQGYVGASWQINPDMGNTNHG